MCELTMGANSKIEWCDHTFNPWEGCTKVSPGCARCYAERRNQRFAGGANWGAGAPRRLRGAAYWKQPKKWELAFIKVHNAWKVSRGMRDGSEFGSEPRRPRVFCASLADVFDEEVPDSWRDQLFETIYACNFLTWMLLTKRPEKMLAYLEGTSGAATNLMPGGCFDHVWVGVSVEDQQRADERIPQLLAIPARVRFVSCEPLLGPVALTRVDFGPQPNTPQSALTPIFMGRYDAKIDWVICGGESGPISRPMHPDWARSLRDQCQAAGVPFFFKQWGEWLPACQYRAGYNERRRANAKHTFDSTNESWRVGKRAAGRQLDGRTHDEFP